MVKQLTSCKCLDISHPTRQSKKLGVKTMVKGKQAEWPLLLVFQ